MTKALLEGLGRFRAEHFPRYAERYRRLAAEGQAPRTLFLGCSDSRVIPEQLTGAGPGDLFVVRNVGAFVPPHEGPPGHHGVSAAIEYAVGVLGVRDVVVCGHSHCGAIRALYEPPAGAGPNVRAWLDLAAPARLAEPPTEEVLRRTEKRAIVVQLDRLLAFPVVREAVEVGRLALHGWYYVIEEGRVEILDLDRKEFVPLEETGPF